MTRNNRSPQVVWRRSEQARALQAPGNENGVEMLASLQRLPIALLCCWLLVALAQSPAPATTDVVLILDASGSMFNKLEDGRYRITAAKEALTDFISRLPADAGLNVGLRVYGSSLLALEEGACEDSILRVPVSGLERDALLRAVQDTQAKGATPIAYSLELAASDLRSTPGRKVIVLVTDGEEACGGDVRGVYQRLIDEGLELDLRVIGFDLNERASASFQGVGTFENATSAADLAAALGRAVAIETPAPVLLDVSVTLTRQGVRAVDGATLAFVTAAGDAYGFEHAGEGVYTAALPAGGYGVRVLDATHGELAFSGLAVVIGEANAFAFEIAPEHAVALALTDSAPVAGRSTEVRFEGAPTGVDGWVGIVPSGMTDDVWLAMVGVDGVAGSVLVTVPRETDALEARYVVQLPEGGTRVIGRSEPFFATIVGASVTTASEAAAGTLIGVDWEGPGGADDFITIVPLGAAEHAYGAYAMTTTGSPVSLLAPIAPGEYEVRYIAGGDAAMLATQAVTVLAATTSVSAPATVLAGTRFEVAWSGPGYEFDWIALVAPGSPEGDSIEYAYVEGGNPLTLQAPISAGTYEIRYVADEEYATLASTLIEVTPVTASVSGPASVAAGEWFEVSWEGPGYESDYVTIVPVGSDAGAWLSYAYTSQGPVVELEAPGEPGAYELRYVNELHGYVILASTPITVR